MAGKRRASHAIVTEKTWKDRVRRNQFRRAQNHMPKDLDVVLWAEEAFEILKEHGHMIWAALLKTKNPNNSSYNLKDGLEDNK